MSVHYEDAGLRLFHGSNKTVLPTFPDEAFDSIVTDPPYELGFMGRGWDSSGIAFDVDLWRECLRVLKPGGYVLAFGGSRTWHRLMVAIEDAGFEIRDSIAWLHGQGFPKSMNVSKAIDAHLAAERQVVGPTTKGGTGRGNVFGKITRPPVTAPATESAREWDGWGTALKPAFEPIVVARKLLSGTVAANVLAYGTGAINIDACRVHSADSEAKPYVVKRFKSGATLNAEGGTWRPDEDDAPTYEGETKPGRFPPNVLLDESQAAALDEQTGVLTSGLMKARTNRQPSKGGVIYGADARNIVAGDTYADSGGVSRFFPIFRYEAKAPGSERPEVDGIVHSTVKPLELMRWLVRLVTRPGGHVLDLFAGSGTTGEAALLEGMDCTLIELEESHLPLILARVRKPLQPSMFGDWDGAA